MQPAQGAPSVRSGPVTESPRNVTPSIAQEVGPNRRSDLTSQDERNMDNNSNSSNNCVSWNICGLATKLGNSDIQKYLSKFDIIFLSETWLTEKDIDIADVEFGNFEVENIVRANLHKRTKRGYGGISVLYNPERVQINVV